MGSAPQVGERAPDFTLPRADGTPFRLSEAVRRGVVVLYFYPKDETMGCVAEACAFRDEYDVFTEAGAEVVGVSMDSSESHRRFAAHHRLPFVLLTDAVGAVRKLYGVGKALGILDDRMTYVIDTKGVVRHVFSSRLQPTRHVAEALAIVRGLAA
ncbi:MAG TPA: peroxiredoxin [Gemmatimonadales bacterium]|nr:peroxiredoxin [Gemmatimonadales bacterium]